MKRIYLDHATTTPRRGVPVLRRILDGHDSLECRIRAEERSQKQCLQP